MAIFDTSDIQTTGLSVTGKVILSGNSAANILTISGDTNIIFTVTNVGTRINTFLIDSINSTGASGNVLSQSATGSVWAAGSSLKWYAENAVAPVITPVATGLGSIAIGDNAKALSPDMFVYGDNAGVGGVSAATSVFIGLNAGSGATNASGSTFIGSAAGALALSGNDSTFIGTNAGFSATSANFSTFIGTNAGFQATNTDYSKFIGYQAGYKANAVVNGNFIGFQAGTGATNATGSTFIGYQAGMNAVNASGSTYIGNSAGEGATNANNSVFIGHLAGSGATSANFSRFIGLGAGVGATNADYSTFIGHIAGSGQTNASKSNFFGFQAGMAFPGNSLNFNNIIIGTNISLPSGATNTMNIGGVLFGNNFYSGLTGTPSITGQTTGQTGSIGINILPGQMTAVLNISPGTTIKAPLQIFTGSSLTTVPLTGAFELDPLNINYYTYAPNSRSINRTEQVLIMTGTTTLTNTAASQALFSAGTVGGGSLTVLAGYTYGFECGFDLSGMSATIGTFGFGISGTSALSTLRYTAVANKAVTNIANPATVIVVRNRASQAISSASTATAGVAQIDGIFRCTGSGTIVPHTILSVAAAAIVAQDSYFLIYPLGANNQFKLGNWT